MIRPPLWCLLAWCLLVWGYAAGADAALSVVDDAGRRVQLARPAERIVSLAPHATELLFAVGAGDRILAAVEFSDHPPAARSLARVGRAGAVDLERVLALRPDLVVVWQTGTPAAQRERLERLGLPVFLSEPRRLVDIPSSLRRLGALAGTDAVAEAAASRFEARLGELRAAAAARPRLSGFYQIWPRPLMTVNGEHLISRVMALCGVDNIFAGLPSLVPQVGIEAVLAADPAIILSSAEAGHEDHEDLAELSAWHAWPSLTAVRAGNLFHIDPDLIQRPSPRILDGVAQVCAAAETARQRLADAP